MTLFYDMNFLRILSADKRDFLAAKILNRAAGSGYFITAFGDVARAVKAIKLGATDLS